MIIQKQGKRKAPVWLAGMAALYEELLELRRIAEEEMLDTGLAEKRGAYASYAIACTMLSRRIAEIEELERDERNQVPLPLPSVGEA